MAAILATSVVVLWIAHVYAHGLGESVDSGRRLTAGEVGAIARRELSIPVAAVLPLSAIVLGALDLIEERTAIWLAVGAGVATLTAQGVRYARLEHLSRLGTAATVAINVVFGLVLVALKVIVAH